MSDGFTQLPPDSTGKKIDTEHLTIGANDVERQRVEIAGVAAAEIARVQATAPGSSDYGLVVRVAPPGVTAADIAKAEDAAAASGDTGVPCLGVRNDALASRTSTDGDYGAPALDIAGRQFVISGAAAVGGCSMYKLVSAATNNAQCPKASAGQVYAIIASNINAAIRYLKFYDKASAPTPGSDTCVWVVPIPGAGTAGAGSAIAIPPGLKFATGIAIAIVTGIADSDNTAVAANEILISLAYA